MAEAQLPAHLPLAIRLESSALADAVAGIPGVLSCRLEKGEVVAHGRADAVFEIMTVLRHDPRFSFEQMVDLCGVDWPSRTPRFDVVYNLLSVTLNQRVRVVIPTESEDAVASIHRIWPVATWWEREAWDLFGIVFSGQPDLRRILTDYGFEGHPLRKDFPLTGYVEVRYDEDRKQVTYDKVRLTQEFRSFDFLSPWEGMTSLPGDEKAHETRMEGGYGVAAPSGPAGAIAPAPGPADPRLATGVKP